MENAVAFSDKDTDSLVEISSISCLNVREFPNGTRGRTLWLNSDSLKCVNHLGGRQTTSVIGN